MFIIKDNNFWFSLNYINISNFFRGNFKPRVNLKPEEFLALKFKKEN